jgi:hypothetical protein
MGPSEDSNMLDVAFHNLKLLARPRDGKIERPFRVPIGQVLDQGLMTIAA